jgi:hypothetical protein
VLGDHPAQGIQGFGFAALGQVGPEGRIQRRGCLGAGVRRRSRCGDIRLLLKRKCGPGTSVPGSKGPPQKLWEPELAAGKALQ